MNVLIIDDSAFNRRTLSEILRALPEVGEVATATDGEEGLRIALETKPDVITLDLEMPRMDGFTFLRLLMAKQPTPVIVVSSYARKANVFRALELGALDFIAKPARLLGDDRESIRKVLHEKIATVAALRPGRLSEPVPPRTERLVALSPPATEVRPGRLRVVAIGASTGGPPALQRIFESLPPDLPAAILVAQHMPARFTEAFAERLARTTGFPVREARDGDTLQAGVALLAPGGKQTEVVPAGSGLRLRVGDALESDPYVPSIDRLFESLAAAAGPRTLGVVLTGMGRDGRKGIEALKEAGGAAVVESEETSLIYGMPREALATGKVDLEAPLNRIPEIILRFVMEGSLERGRVS
ncbi:MAG: chemotaxis response regulator protein-glutamate methylesterase [Deltaproteobacteria bacterium]|nr:MAG: chemotaxis response regulator protein-glutamate methylesterase [Deltaproteobacteria bacterium]